MARDKVVRFSVWVVGILLVLLLLPGVVGVFWVPSCQTCHRDEEFVEKTQASAHSNVDCKTCHGGQNFVDALAYRQNVVYKMLIPIIPHTAEGLAHVPSKVCYSCHEGVYSETTTSNGIRIRHESCAPRDGGSSSACTECHATVAHGESLDWATQYDMMRCLSCHSQEGVSNERENCAFCHDGSYDAPVPSSGSEFKATHGADWEKTHGMGDMTTCQACHSQSYCAPCHGEAVPHPVAFIMSHGAVAKSSGDKCLTCHQDKFCSDCHNIEMPHPSGFLQEHSDIANDRGREFCYTCHVKADCDGCHTAHIHPGGAIR